MSGCKDVMHAWEKARACPLTPPHARKAVCATLPVRLSDPHCLSCPDTLQDSLSNRSSSPVLSFTTPPRDTVSMLLSADYGGCMGGQLAMTERLQGKPPPFSAAHSPAIASACSWLRLPWMLAPVPFRRATWPFCHPHPHQ